MFKEVFLNSLGATIRLPRCANRPLVRGLCTIILLTFGLLEVFSATAAPAEGSLTLVDPDTRAVKVTTHREGNVTHFCVENKELCEVTMTFEMDLVNLKASADFPCTVTLPPRQTTETFKVWPNEPGAKWEFSYTNYYKLGSQNAKHDDSYVYQLPYAPGCAFRVTQAYGGSFSHTGSNKYAIDWKMPEGTPVYAARGGTVVKVKDNSNTGGANIKYDPYNNYVLIRHEDATLGHYCHLQKGSSHVRPGQVVHPGDLLALSGNTGFSSGPHLHFSVFQTKSGRQRESIPVKFKTEKDTSITLRSGRNYKAAAVESDIAHTVGTPDLSAQGGVIQ
jgi:murein DD-endopeptidase MepM/ murein hydrolase activator NlpD